jgi:hypothetical protein
MTECTYRCGPLQAKSLMQRKKAFSMRAWPEAAAAVVRA